VNRIGVDRHVDRHSGEIQHGAHRVAAQQQPYQKSYNLICKPAFEPQDGVEKKEQPLIGALKRINAVSAYLSGLLFKAYPQNRAG